MQTFLGILLAIIIPSSALGSCFEPDKPFCVNGYQRFSSSVDFENCKNDLDRYRDEVEDYLACLKRKSNDAIDEYNDAVQDFNTQAGQ
jgi:hypothetical protein